MKIYIPEFRAMAKCNQHLDHGPIDIDLGPDVVRVVRCRDCKHLRPEVDAYTQETVGYWCAELDIGSVDVDGFCNRGERKETDHE